LLSSPNPKVHAIADYLHHDTAERRHVGPAELAQQYIVGLPASQVVGQQRVGRGRRGTRPLGCTTRNRMESS